MIHYEIGNLNYTKNLLKKLIKTTHFISAEENIINSIYKDINQDKTKPILNLKLKNKSYNNTVERENILIHKLYHDYIIRANKNLSF